MRSLSPALVLLCLQLSGPRLSVPPAALCDHFPPALPLLCPRLSGPRATNLVDKQPRCLRQRAIVEAISTMGGDAQWADKNGIQVRVTRTIDAATSAETRLLDAMHASGSGVDELANVFTRSTSETAWLNRSSPSLFDAELLDVRAWQKLGSRSAHQVHLR